MKRNLLVLITIFAAPAAFSQTVFYGGDPLASDTQNYFATVNGLRSRMVTFDDFRWNTANPVTGLFGNFISNQTFSRGYYEVRTGISAGNGGVLVASGAMNVDATDMGQSNVTGNSGSFRRYFVHGSISPLNLTQGSVYFLSFSIDFQGNTLGQGAIRRTSGIGGIGTPLANGNLFHDQPGVGVNYESRAGDVSYGLEASSVPEPATLALIGFGFVGLMRRRKES